MLVAVVCGVLMCVFVGERVVFVVVASGIAVACCVLRVDVGVIVVVCIG